VPRLFQQQLSCPNQLCVADSLLCSCSPCRLPPRLRQSPVLPHLILINERASERNGKTSTQWSDKYSTTSPQAAAARTPGGALPLPMHAGSTQHARRELSVFEKAAPPRRRAAKVRRHHHHRAVPAPEATAHSSRLVTAVPRCGGAAAAFFLFLAPVSASQQHPSSRQLRQWTLRQWAVAREGQMSAMPAQSGGCNRRECVWE
jgi:hypothetical protein